MQLSRITGGIECQEVLRRAVSSNILRVSKAQRGRSQSAKMSETQLLQISSNRSSPSGHSGGQVSSSQVEAVEIPLAHGQDCLARSGCWFGAPADRPDVTHKEAEKMSTDHQKGMKYQSGRSTHHSSLLRRTSLLASR